MLAIGWARCMMCSLVNTNGVQAMPNAIEALIEAADGLQLAFDALLEAGHNAAAEHVAEHIAAAYAAINHHSNVSGNN
jgi:hypothetical protein